MLGLISSGELRAREQIRVGGYDFLPYVNLKADKGITLSAIEILNASQDKYEFVFVETSANRRYKDLMDGNYDVIFFEDPKWGWKEYASDLITSTTMAIDHEKYISQKTEEKGQSFFKKITTKNKIVILGYHYKFANFNADQKVLKSQYLAEVTHTPESVVEAVAAGRKDVGLVANSYIQSFFKGKPEYKDKVLVSEIDDQTYKMKMIAKKSGKIKAAQMSKWIKALKSDQRFQSLLKEYGIKK